MSLKYVKGNVLDNLDKVTEPTLLIHVCNDAGGFGSGVAGAIAKKYPDVRDAYMEWWRAGYFNNTKCVKNNVDFKLGQIQPIEVETNVLIVNMIAQSTPGGHDFKIGKENIHLRPLRLESLRECLYRVAQTSVLFKPKCKVIGPMFGSALAGGNWDKEIEPLIYECLVKFGVDVTIFKFE